MKKEKGFTLIELMVVITVVSTMMVIAVPLLKQSMINNRLMFEAQSLYNTLSFARTEAIRRNDYVSVCPSNNGTSCNGSDYSKGIIVYLNSSLSGLNNQNQIIKVYDQWSGNDNGKIITGATTFNGAGYLQTNTINNLLVCNPSYKSYTININLLGKVTINSNPNDGGC